jgi:ribosomal protein S18 acetylase RimI-like enzyme
MLNIRSFQPDDEEEVRRLFAQGQLDFAQGTELEEEAMKYIEGSLSNDLADISGHYLKSSDSHFWVAEVDGLIKGSVGVYRRADGEAELRRMSVAEDCRRQGIGRKLLRTAEEFCRRQGYQRVYLTSATHMSAAVAMYQKAGYQLIYKEPYGEFSRITAHQFVKYLSEPVGVFRPAA